MPARDNPRDQGAVDQDREFEELLSKAVQHLEAKGQRIPRVEPPAAKKRASAA
jgi:hypothetical protein